MFQFQQNFKNLKSIAFFSSLHQKNQLPSRTALHSRFLFSISDSTKKITLPKINNEKLLTTIFTDTNNKFYRFYGDKAYNYYAVRALNLKLPNATRKEFVKITGVLVTRKFLAEVARVCELDKMLLSYNKSGVNCNLGEIMEAYCSGMLFSGMEEEMKKFASDVVDYYLKKNNKGNIKNKK
jgi:dsRNA-specific ribonuclease